MLHKHCDINNLLTVLVNGQDIYSLIIFSIYLLSNFSVTLTSAGISELQTMTLW